MSLWSRIKSAALVAWYGAYEAAKRTADRTYIPPWVLEPHMDFDAATRLDLIAKCQHFERNDGVFNKLCDVFEQYTVGPNGLQFIPATSDEDFNQAASDSWNEFCGVCDLVSLQGMGTLQSQVARRWFTDGQIFILPTYGSESGHPNNKGPRPRIQLIESHRIQSPPSASDNVRDGILVDKNGRPLVIYVRDGESYTPRLASEMIQVFEPHRPGALHGLPFATPVINDIIDLRNLQYLEMLAAKDAAEKSTVIETENGELNPAVLRRQRLSDSTIDSQGTEVATTNISSYREVLGARTIALKKGEKVTQFVSQRPSVATKEYWEYLTSRICAGCGPSKQLIFPWSMQGTVVRADLDAAAAYFKSRSSVLATAFRRVYNFYMDWAVKNDPRLKNAPKDYRAANVRFPRAVNVDVGRNSVALIAEYEACIRNLEMLCGELGEDWRKVIRGKAREEAFIDRVAKEEGTTPERIKAALAELLQKESPPAQAA